MKKELTVTSIVMGIIMAVLFGAANAYLGLRVGMTVSASIPAAVISMGVLRMILRKNSILENNMVQTIGSAGESLAAGAIFTMPVLFMWALEGKASMPSIVELACIALFGGILGVLFMIPLRKTLIVQEHGKLIYPEGTACAQVLKAGEKGGSQAGMVFAGLGIASVYKFIADGLKIFPSEVDFSIKKYKGAGIGIDVLPALLGVGYICNIKTSALMMAGGIMSWLVLMPLISFFGGSNVFYPGTQAITDMGTWDLWGSYIRYIGAGAVAAAGIISLIKTFPLMVKTFTQAMKGFRKDSEDLPIWVVLVGILVIAVLMWLLPFIPVNLFGALIIVVFGFFFATVSSRMVGAVGSSNNPISGMTIATLIAVCVLFKLTGNDSMESMIAAIVIGSVICIVAAMAGDTSQDLKTGFLVGATPKKQQIGEVIGAIVSALAIGAILFLLSKSWGYGSEELPAVQASLMKMVVEGVMGENLPWNLILIGAMIAVVGEFMRIPVLSFAVGMYLPIHLSVAIFCGGLLRFITEKSKKNKEEAEAAVEKGILYSSGMIAGEGLIGILLAGLAVINVGDTNVASIIKLSSVINLGNFGALAAFAIFIAIMCYFIFPKKKDEITENMQAEAIVETETEKTE